MQKSTGAASGVLIMAKIPILRFHLDGREEQFGVLVKCSVSIFLLIITDLEKKNKKCIGRALRED